MESAVVIDCWSESNSSLAGMRANYVRPYHWRRIHCCRHHRIQRCQCRIDRSWFHSWRWFHRCRLHRCRFHRGRSLHIRLHRCRRRCLSRIDHRCSTSASQAFVGTLDDSVGRNSMHPGMKVHSSRCFPLHIRTDSILDSPLLYIC